MKSKFESLWLKPSSEEEKFHCLALSLKQRLVDQIGCPAENQLIHLCKLSNVGLSDDSGSSVSFNVMQFVDAENRRFVCLLDPMELRILHQACETILQGKDSASN